MLIDIDKLIQQAMKSKNQEELRAYRNLKSEFLKAETAKGAEPLDETKQIQIIKKYCENLEKSILSFSGAGREDLASEYRDELAVLRKLLPEPVNEQQIYSELKEWCLSNHFTQQFWTVLGAETHLLISKKEMGNAIKHLKSKFPQADGKIISNIVKEYVV